MKTLFTLVSLICLSSAVYAETITFKDGRVVTGKILQRDVAQVKVDLSGLTMTYYTEEIKDIDGTAVAPVVTPKLPEPAKVVVPEVTSPAIVPSVEDPIEKKALILKFIDVFGTRKAMTANFNAMLDQAAQQKPDDAQKIRDRFKIDEVIERLIPSYDKHFTSQELKTYIDFYGSEQGQKLIAGIGGVTKESVEIVSRYVQEKFPELEK